VVGAAAAAEQASRDKAEAVAFKLTAVSAGGQYPAFGADMPACNGLCAAGVTDTNRYRWNAQISWRVDTCFNGRELVEDKYFEEIGYTAVRFRCSERGCVGRK
jgi:hypothetical protein